MSRAHVRPRVHRDPVVELAQVDREIERFRRDGTIGPNRRQAVLSFLEAKRTALAIEIAAAARPGRSS